MGGSGINAHDFEADNGLSVWNTPQGRGNKGCVEQLFFTGEYDLTLDDKSRLMIPAPFRKRINAAEHGEGFYLVLSHERRLWLYPDRYYEWLQNFGYEADAIPRKDLLAYDRLVVGSAVPLEADKAGRLVLPEKSRSRVALGKDVTMVGMRDHLEVWDRSAWNAAIEASLAQGDALAERARMARRGESPYRTQTVSGLENGL